MQYIAFDFETSGLPEGRRNVEITQETLKNFDSCRAVSLSAARFSSRGRLIDTFDAILHKCMYCFRTCIENSSSVLVQTLVNSLSIQNGAMFIKWRSSLYL